MVVALVAVVGYGTAGCRAFARSDTDADKAFADAEAKKGDDNASYGAGLDVDGEGDGAPSTTASTPGAGAPGTTAGRGSSTQSGPATTGVAAPSGSAPTVANRTERLDASGIQLTLVAADATTFKRTDTITFELTFTNKSSEMRYHHPNQQIRFGLFRLDGGEWKQEWVNTECAPSNDDALTTGPIELPPGEQGRFVDEYPVKGDFYAGHDPNSCRVPAGKYSLLGYLEWCPEATMKRGEYDGKPYCDADVAERIAAKPLAITITD